MKMSPQYWLRRLVFVGFCAATGSAQAGALLDSYRLALSHDAEFEAARAELAASEGSYTIQRAFLLPEVTAQGGINYTYQDVNSDFFGGFSESYLGWNAELNVRGAAWRYETAAALRLGKKQEAAAALRFGQAGQALVFRVVDRYLNVLGARAQQRFAVAQLDALQQERDKVKDRFDVGAVPGTDYADAQARADLAEADLIEANATLHNAEDTLLEVTGEYPGSIVDLRKSMPMSLPKPADAEEWVRQSKDGNVDVLIARAEVDLADASVTIAQGALWPKLDYGANLSKNDQSRSRVGQDREAGDLRLTLTMPLYRGGSDRAKIKQAEARRSSTQANNRRIHRQVQRETRTVYRSIEASLKRIVALQRSIDSTQKALRAVRDGYEIGTRTVSDVLDARVNVLASKREFELSRYDYLRQNIRLHWLVGQLSKDQIVRLDALLEGSDDAPAGTSPAGE